MSGPQSKREASKKATELMADAAASKTCLRLPKNTLEAPAAIGTKCLAEAREAGDLLKLLGFAHCPIEEFNNLKDSEKELVMKDLLVNFCKFFHQDGANLVPADSQYYSKMGLPTADRSLMQGAQLLAADEDEEMELEMAYKGKRDDHDETIHGEHRWPPNLEIGGNCTRPVSMDRTGRVDLQHDPYCLRRHFTTRWGVLKDQGVRGAPRGGSTVEWDDGDCTLVTAGEHAGLWVDLNLARHLRKAYTVQTGLVDLISTHLLSYRIMVNFAAPPCTEEDGYKCGWSYHFWNQDDPTCSLVIREHKAWPEAHFRGSEQASMEALQLLEWLAGNNCPHSYDYTPCGRQA